MRQATPFEADSWTDHFSHHELLASGVYPDEPKKKNTIGALMEFFDVDFDEFVRFWNSLSDKEWDYYSTVDLV